MKEGSLPDLRAIVELNADGIVVVDAAGRIRFLNPAAAALFGRAEDELLGEELGFPVAAGAGTEVEIVRRGGELVHAELRVARVRWEDEDASLVALRDVTDRRRAERAERERFRAEAAREEAEAAARKIAFLADAGAILGSSLDYRATLSRVARLAVPFLADYCVVYVQGDDGEIPQVAAAHVDPAGDALLARLAETYRVDPANPLTPVPQVLRGGRPLLVARVPADAAERLTPEGPPREIFRALGPASYMVVPLAAHERTFGALALATSVSGRRYGEEDLSLAEELARRAATAVENARLFEQAQAANRAKSEFLAMMSHEIRTPINAIVGYTDLLLMGLSGPVTEAQEGQLERIRVSGRHLIGLVDQVLDYARIESGTLRVERRTASVAEAVETALTVLQPQAAARGVELSASLDGCAGLRYLGDPHRVDQVLVNLLSNAIKFTEPGGSTRLACAARDDGPPAGEGRAGRWVCLSVEDTGVGIAPEEAE
ncbi:MAG: histidine kinase dimerization/phospho-acceptor domain-containing protein, partial [Longimicrobiaceae bacterium]